MIDCAMFELALPAGFVAMRTLKPFYFYLITITVIEINVFLTEILVD